MYLWILQATRGLDRGLKADGFIQVCSDHHWFLCEE